MSKIDARQLARPPVSAFSSSGADYLLRLAVTLICSRKELQEVGVWTVATPAVFRYPHRRAFGGRAQGTNLPLREVRYVARFEICEKVFEIADQFFFRHALSLIVRVIIQETKVVVSILPVGKLCRFHASVLKTARFGPAGAAFSCEAGIYFQSTLGV